MKLEDNRRLGRKGGCGFAIWDDSACFFPLFYKLKRSFEGARLRGNSVGLSAFAPGTDARLSITIETPRWILQI